MKMLMPRKMEMRSARKSILLTKPVKESAFVGKETKRIISITFHCIEYIRLPPATQSPVDLFGGGGKDSN